MPLPREPDIAPAPFGAQFPAKKFSRNLDTVKYVETLEQNQKLHLCCRHVEESGHVAQYFCTPTAEVKDDGRVAPDILVITCGDCGRNHTRFMVGGGERTILEAR